MLTNDGRDWLLLCLAATPNSPYSGSPITYMAIGDSPTVLSEADKTLVHEVFRKEITERYTDDGVFVFEMYVDKDEANFNWREAGLFAGGSLSPDTGTLIARALVEENKDDMKTATLVWELAFANKS
jgi:hypothetical protein